MIFTNYVSNKTLDILYKKAFLFVFPSLNEGFGLTPLEAISRGAPTIAASSGSLPEVILNEKALFDPLNHNEFISIFERSITDNTFREELSKSGKKNSEQFSWKISAKLTKDFLLKKYKVKPQVKTKTLNSIEDFLTTNFEQHFFSNVRNQYDIISMSKLIANTFKRMTSNIHNLEIKSKYKNNVPNFENLNSPLVFSSCLCREVHFRMPLYKYLR